MGVYREYDQAALDRQYTSRATAPDADRFLAERAVASVRVRNAFHCWQNVPYGPSPSQRLDVFPSGGHGGPVEMYIHGGFWRAGSKDDASFIAEALVPEGVALIAVDYSLAPTATIDEIVGQVRDAVKWVYDNASSFGADCERLFVSGHSAGAHLAAMLLMNGWATRYGLPANVIKGACLVSGLYDLEPIRLSYLNKWVQLDVRSARRNSPLLHIPTKACQIILSVGGKETAEFQRQSHEFEMKWTRAGHKCVPVEMQEHHHFSVVLELGNPRSALTTALLTSVRLDSPEGA